jgi:VanZ family protein
MNFSFKYWTPAICIAALITLFSTSHFSGEETSRIIIPLFHWLFPTASRHMLHLIHNGVRKLAHIIEFAGFSIAVFHGVRGGRKGWQFDWAVLTLLIAVGLAGLDEWHQSFVPLREASLRDVMIDSFGALLAQVCVWLYSKWNRSSADSTELRKTALEI